MKNTFNVKNVKQSLNPTNFDIPLPNSLTDFSILSVEPIFISIHCGSLFVTNSNTSFDKYGTLPPYKYIKLNNKN